MSDQDSIKAAAETALQRLGGLDVLVISTANSTPEYLATDATHDSLQRVHVQGTDTLIKVGGPTLLHPNLTTPSSHAWSLPPLHIDLPAVAPTPPVVDPRPLDITCPSMT